jgi:hypothetical protein
MKKIVNCGLLALVVFFGVSCASTPSSAKKTLSISEFSESKVAIVNFSVAPHSKAHLPLIDAGIYNTALKSAESSFLPLQDKGLENLYSRITDFLKSTYSIEDINVPLLDDAKDEKTLTYYSKPSETVKSKIIETCAETGADYFIGTIGQIITLGVSALGLTGSNTITFSVTIFDASGNIITGDVFSVSPIIMVGSDYNKLASLFDLSGGYMESLYRDTIR